MPSFGSVVSSSLLGPRAGRPHHDTTSCVLKFAIDSKDPAGPDLVGLGLSFENLRRLRTDSIQFHGSEVGLGDGVFVIAHIDDPQLSSYQGLPCAVVCELLVLTEHVCRQFETSAPVVRIPLKSTRNSRRCEAVLFAGSTEQELVAAMKAAGLVTSATSITGPDEPPAHTPVSPSALAEPAARAVGPSVFPVAVLQKLKLGGGGLGFIAITGMLASRPHIEGWVCLLMGGTAVVFLALLAVRWSERVEIDRESIRCRRPIGGFEVAWRDVASIAAREDSLGPFELHLVTRSGARHKLRRIYARWDELVAASSAH